jgi:hypothetical protein
MAATNLPSFLLPRHSLPPSSPCPFCRQPHPPPLAPGPRSSYNRISSFTQQTFPSALLSDEHGTFSDVLRHFRLMTCGCAELERTSTMAPPPPLYGLDTARAAVEQLVHEVVKCKHSMSMVLIGPRGCGKSSLVNAVLDDLQRKYAPTTFPQYVFVTR